MILFGYGEEFEWIREWPLLWFFGLPSFSFPEDYPSLGGVLVEEESSSFDDILLGSSYLTYD